VGFHVDGHEEGGSCLHNKCLPLVYVVGEVNVEQNYETTDWIVTKRIVTKRVVTDWIVTKRIVTDWIVPKGSVPNWIVPKGSVRMVVIDLREKACPYSCPRETEIYVFVEANDAPLFSFRPNIPTLHWDYLYVQPMHVYPLGRLRGTQAIARDHSIRWMLGYPQYLVKRVGVGVGVGVMVIAFVLDVVVWMDAILIRYIFS